MAADKVQLAQDPDVLDTWFSSGEAGNKIVKNTILEKACQCRKHLLVHSLKNLFVLST